MVAPLVGAWIEITTLQHCDIEALVAPLVGAWIEITDPPQSILFTSPSLLSWERGLKLPVSHVVGLLFSSLLSWERGLKSFGKSKC